MSFLTDIADFFSGSNKTHDQLNSFVNEKFTFFLNNSNLLLNFVSDFEDYKNGTMQEGKSKCNECEDLYILTTDIFEKYFNKINIPYNIDVSEGSSKTNYNNKVLYFFDLKDLKKILDEENLEKSSSDNTQFNKKRLLCKIISLSFIKIYIIVKSIYQTFNIYNSLITNDSTNNNTNVYEDRYNEPYNPSNSNEFNPYNTTNEFNPYNTTNEFNPSETAEPPYLAPPQETIPEETIPEETLPEETVPTPITGPVLPPITGQVLPPITGQVLPPITYPVLPPITGPGPTETIPSVPGPIETVPNEIVPPQETVPNEIVPPQETVPSETFPTVPGPTETIPTETVPTDPFEKADLIQENQNKYIGPNQIGPNQIGPNQIGPNQTGGNMFKNIFDKLLGNKTETTETTATTSNNGGLEFSPSPVPNIGTSPEPNLREENIKLQRSKNIFYSIFVILFEDSKSDPLDTTNFNVKFLTKGLNNMTNETLAVKIPEIIKYIVASSIFSEEFLGESCLLFRDDNFKFMKLETSASESKEATIFVDEVDKQHQSFNKIIETKRKLLGTILNKENRDPLFNYSNSQPQLPFANYKFFNAFKSHLKTMIKNYFSSRANLYNNIVKELFIFDKKSSSITGLNSKLTYKYISELSKKTEIILLDLHIALFKTLNNILTDSVNEISVMKKMERPHGPIQSNTDEYIGGAKTKTRRKRNIGRNIVRSIKRKRNKTKTRKATNKSRK